MLEVSSKLHTYANPQGTAWTTEELLLVSKYIKWRSWLDDFYS